MKIEGKRVLITGGSSGIGLALAQAMLAKGAKVVVTGRRPEALARGIEKLRGTGSPVWSVAADVATPEGPDETITQAVAALGGLDILVNNAGGVRAGRLESTPEAELRAMIEVDLVAPILLTRAALPALRASGEAMVVSVAPASLSSALHSMRPMPPPKPVSHAPAKRCAASSRAKACMC
jgi:NAD(P)-dependent dehydrogenase (short-subunit alcohol dehydrogenase family)